LRSGLAARRALRAEWRLKLTLSAALTLFFCLPYFTIQRVPLMPILALPGSAIDRAVPFVPGWVWLYQSVYLLLSIVPWLAVSADDLRRYARGFILQSSIGFAFFLLLPIEAPRPVELPQEGMYAWLVSYDRPLNSFPSLHVGLAVYTALFGAAASRARLGGRIRALCLMSLAIWVCGIAVATLFTKQHYAVDLPAGALLGWLCHRWAWARPFERSLHVATIGSGDRADPLGSMPDTICRGPAATGAGERSGGGGSPGASRPAASLRTGHPRQQHRDAPAPSAR
jgi:membrane-associated phospholipid phosphatase